MYAISIKIHDRYSQYGKPSISNEIDDTVDDENFLDYAEKAVLRNENIVIVDRRNVMTNEQHKALLEIAAGFDVDEHPRGYAETELNLLLKKVI